MNKAGISGSNLFGQLPQNLFRLLGGNGTQAFYAELLEHLEDEVFRWTATLVPQGDAMTAIREFIEHQGRGVPIEEDAGERAVLLPEQRAAIAYRRLIETGWLVEYRDRFRRSVDFNGYARVILQLLLDIKSGRTRSYGSEVMSILASLETAIREPAERAQNIRSAAQSATSFLNYLRAVASAIRGVEQQISITAEIAPLFKQFFEDFISEHLVEDFKKIHTQSNPFRFAVRIKDCCDEILEGTLLLDSLASGYVREGMARDLPEAREIIGSEVGKVAQIIDALGDHLEIIEQIARRLETRIRNTVRHMDRIAEADTEGAVAAMRALGRVRAKAVPSGPMPLLLDAPLMGLDSFYQAPKKRLPVARGVLRKPEPDPAFDAYREDLNRYRDRMAVTPAKIRAYLERAMDGRITARAADLPLESLDDFVVVERLPLLHWAGGDAVAGRFEVDVLDGEPFRSDWLVCPNFTIRRVRAHEMSHD